MKIALAFSGGGYRASAFNLGTITYLNRIQFEGEPLLKKVVALSTVSGGTITGARYAVGIKRGETMEEIYRSLYHFFMNIDLVSGSINYLKSNEGWNKRRVKSLINSFADLYDLHLFKREKFGLLLNGDNPIHLKHISFNATEFTTGLQFRFQVSGKIASEGGKPEKGLIGNYYHHIPESLAKNIRMADILASSSCFPGGFEPINFPQDFVLPEIPEISNFMKDKRFPIGLMNGGIVDNQGIEPLLLAEKRMKLDNPECKTCVLDLLIVSDVSSPYMEGFTASTQQEEKGWRTLTLSKLQKLSAGVFLISTASLVAAMICKLVVPVFISTVAVTFSALVLIAITALKKALKHVQIIDIKKIRNLSHVKFVVFESFLKNRFMSVMKLTGSVFMKHIRRLNFRSIYNHDEWKNRRIMNAIYELRPGEKKTEEYFKNKTLPEYLKPSPEIQRTSEIAASMGTTLWFKEGEEGKRMLDTLLACGQYNICWNLLGYIDSLKKIKPEEESDINENHRRLIACEDQLRQDWERFQKDPYWLVKEYNKGL